eukprot:m.167126 g.167126  ORF g.167126 m.167126 type:complete len:55 (+) comp15245_c0_seq3:1715-1879(+)
MRKLSSNPSNPNNKRPPFTIPASPCRENASVKRLVGRERFQDSTESKSVLLDSL